MKIQKQQGEAGSTGGRYKQQEGGLPSRGWKPLIFTFEKEQEKMSKSLKVRYKSNRVRRGSTGGRVRYKQQEGGRAPLEGVESGNQRRPEVPAGANCCSNQQEASSPPFPPIINGITIKMTNNLTLLHIYLHWRHM